MGKWRIWRRMGVDGLFYLLRLRADALIAVGAVCVSLSVGAAVALHVVGHGFA